MSSKTVIAISICKFPFFTLSERFRFLLPQDYAEKDIISIIAGNRGKIQSYLPILSNFTVLCVGPKAADEFFELFGLFVRNIAPRAVVLFIEQIAVNRDRTRFAVCVFQRENVGRTVVCVRVAARFRRVL